MQSIESYYMREDTLTDVVHGLSDPDLDFRRDRQEVNTLVLNLTIKYLATYLGLSPNASIEKIRESATKATRRTQMEDYLFSLEAVAGILGAKVSLFENDTFSLECLTDLRATAAILKEIIFNERFAHKNRNASSFVGVDFGSGTGALMVAGLIAARRLKINHALMIGLEGQQKAIDKSRLALSKVFSNSEFRVIKADITDPQIMAEFENVPLSYWISETIGNHTPPISCKAGQWKTADDILSQLSVRATSKTDPYVTVFTNTVSSVPNFPALVKSGEIAMFPDVINGLYTPNNGKSTMRLKTALVDSPTPLSHIGTEFDQYEDLGLGICRWPVPGASS